MVYQLVSIKILKKNQAKPRTPLRVNFKKKTTNLKNKTVKSNNRTTNYSKGRIFVYIFV